MRHSLSYLKKLFITHRVALSLGCWLFLAPEALLALDPAKTLSQYNCQNWTHQDGLPVNRINSITQTRDGRIWFATQKGLVVFDGVRFNLITLPSRPEFPSQNVSCLSSSSRNGLWFGVASGSFGFYDGRQYIPFESHSWMEAGMNVIAIREAADASLWIGGDKGAARVIRGDTNANAFFDQTGNCSSFYDDRKGRVWLGTVQHGLFYWEKGQLNSFPDETLKQSIIFTIAEDSQGNLWLGTENGARCYGANFQSNNIPDIFNEVRALLLDRCGVLWMGTRGNGLGRFQNGNFSFLRKTDGLVSDFITSLYEDQEGSIWVGTKDGLSQLSDLKFPNFSASEGLLPGQCHSVAASKNGGLWVALDRGVSWFDGKTVTNFSSEAGLATPYVKRAYEATNGNVYLIDGAKNIEILSGGKIVAKFPSQDWPAGIVETSEGVVVSVGGNLFLVSTNGLNPYPFKSQDAAPMYWIYNLCSARDGGFWVASANGIFHVENGTYERWGLEDGLSSTKVNWLSEDREGVLWAGLTIGMARVKNGKVDCFSRDEGLFDNYIYAIVPDDFGNFWVQSSRGIFRVRQKLLDDFAAKSVQRIECTGYDGLEALKTIDTTEIESSGCQTADGRIWFPSPGGVIMIDPARIYTNSVPPPVRFERVRVNALEITGQTNSELQPGSGQLEIDYAAASFIAPQSVQFKYLLDGFDRAWIDAGNRRSAFYANLKPGKYRFRVQACNSDGVWNVNGASIQFALLPHFYQAAWFKIIIAAAVVGVLIGIYALLAWQVESRQRKLEMENHLLESKVCERTAKLETLHRQLVDASREAGKAEVATSVLHNVGNVLNSVNVSADLLKQRIGNSRLDNLAKLTALVREHRNDLPRFLTEHEKGRQLLPYLEILADHSSVERRECLGELEALSRNIEHIKNIVATQQSYARVLGVAETIDLAGLLEDALSMHTAAYQRHSVEVIREFGDVPPITVDRHKVLQILINLLHNAKYACEAARISNRKIIVRISASGPAHVKIFVTDNGIGIAPENLTRIFSHGFTTRKAGHGFGLHSGALAAREMGGSLKASSDGVGKGATFTLELPLHCKFSQPEAGESASDAKSLVASH